MKPDDTGNWLASHLAAYRSSEARDADHRYRLMPP